MMSLKHVLGPRFGTRILPAASTYPAHSHLTTRNLQTTSDTTKTVYESPLGAAVLRLRGVSLLSSVLSGIGLPAYLIFMKNGGDTGLWAVTTTVTTAGLSSTAALHWVFGPYVYKVDEEEESLTLTAYTRTWYLATVATNLHGVQPYSAWTRPLCNFECQQRHLFVHTEFVTHAALSAALGLPPISPAVNPDTALLKEDEADPGETQPKSTSK